MLCMCPFISLFVRDKQKVTQLQKQCQINVQVDLKKAYFQQQYFDAHL